MKRLTNTNTYYKIKKTLTTLIAIPATLLVISETEDLSLMVKYQIPAGLALLALAWWWGWFKREDYEQNRFNGYHLRRKW